MLLIALTELVDREPKRLMGRPANVFTCTWASASRWIKSRRGTSILEWHPGPARATAGRPVIDPKR